mgnify:CR=1 FL=1|jgi:hypothetical protein
MSIAQLLDILNKLAEQIPGCTQVCIKYMGTDGMANFLDAEDVYLDEYKEVIIEAN